jgi:RES domain-containing protein
MKLYRVHPYLESAAPHDPGGALYVPIGGRGRFDNPKLYRALYASADPLCAVIERFGDFDEWSSDTFLIPTTLASHPLPLVLSAYEADIVLHDLALVDTLHTLAVERAPDVVTRDRARTQALAAQIFTSKDERHGLAWWSFYNPDLTNVMLWNTKHIRTAGAPQILTVQGEFVTTAARRFHRRLNTVR